MNIEKRIDDLYNEIVFAVSDIKENPSQENLDALKKALNKFYENDATCNGVIFTSNLDKLFFGLYVMPDIDADDVITTITQDNRLLIHNYYLELDSRLFGMDLNLTGGEIAAFIIHDIGSIVGDSSPCEVVKRAIDKYLHDNHEVLKLSDSIHYKELLSFGFRDAVRKYTTIFEKRDYHLNHPLTHELIFGNNEELKKFLASAFDKIDRLGLNYNREVDNKFMTLSWILRVYKDIKHNRIPAIKTLQRCQELTPSQIERKELNNLLRRINRIDDDMLLEAGSLYKKLSIPLHKIEDNCDDIALRVNNVDNEPDQLPELIHGVNNQMSILDDYLYCNPEMEKVYLKQWKAIYKKLEGFRTRLETKSASLFDPQIKLKNTWKAEMDV